MNAEKPLGRYDSVDRAVNQNGEEAFIGNTDANGRQTVISPEQILKSYGDHTVAERTAYNQGVIDNGGTIPEATKIPVTNADEVNEGTAGQTATPVEVIPAVEPPPVPETIATTTAAVAPETAVTEPESINSAVEKQLGEIAETLKTISAHLTELLEKYKQIEARLDKLEGKEPEDTTEETPEEKAQRDPRLRQELHFSMLDADGQEDDDIPEEPPEEEKKSRWQRVKNRVRYYVGGGKQENNPDGDPDAESDPEKKKSKKRALILGAIALGSLVAAGYLMKNGIPWPFGGGKDALSGVDLSGIDPNSIHAKNPEQFHQGVVKLLGDQNLHLNGGPLTPQEMSHMNEWMQAHGGIASGMEAAPSGLEQHITNMPDLGEHFSNVQASAEQGFPVGQSGTGREKLYGYVRELEKLGRTFTRG